VGLLGRLGARIAGDHLGAHSATLTGVGVDGPVATKEQP
jgi:hypothetical protein